MPMMFPIQTKVVPYIGTWIETMGKQETFTKTKVVPYIGTWIETLTVHLEKLLPMSYLI